MRPRRVSRPAWMTELAAVRAEEAAHAAHAAGGVSTLQGETFTDRTGLQLRKWSLIHKILHDNPFHVSEHLSRAEQWTRVRDHIMRTLAEPDIIDWLNQQIDIARHLALGIQDLRPRKSGPCHAVLMEWVANRKHKALAVHRWALAAVEADVPITVHHQHPTGTDGSGADRTGEDGT